jgi:para-aminobenzoate synthetase component 1
MKKMGHVTNRELWTVIPYRGKFLKFYNPIEAYQVFTNRLVDLVSDETIIFDVSENWEDFLDSFGQGPGYNVIHLFYEFSKLTMRELEFNGEIGFIFRFKDKAELESLPSIEESIDLKTISSPKFSSYKKRFDRLQENLNKGNCYQINLTDRFQFQSDQLTQVDPLSLIGKVWNQSCGAYAHATYIKELDRLLFSNSPECLYQVEGKSVYSMPIKGTIALESDEEFDSKWEELINCPKNQAELDMITDLLRNDLSRLQVPRALVEKRKSALVVHKILHQYSKVKVRLKSSISLSRFIKSLFPGGSITGAPKQRVCELIESIEKTSRGFYCGSTILFHKNEQQTFHASSINIRSADIDLKNGYLTYGAGGGVTLRSGDTEEFDEMELKVQSFIDLFKGTVDCEQSHID